MREDILTIIGNEKNVSNVIVLTHNIDFIFIQTVVLKYLKKCGNPSLTIFADAQCVQESYDNQKFVISGLGKRYRVIPVPLHHSHDRFHPKAVLLSGEDKASLFVGSGNLTFGGWRQNAEIWNQYDTQIDGTGAVHAFKNYLDDVLKRLPTMPNVERAVTEAYDVKTKIWASTLDEPSNLIGRVNTKRSLLEQMKEYATPGCTRLIIQSPYFDKQGKTIGELNEFFNPKKIEIFAQSKYSELTQNIIDKLPSNTEVISTAFIHDMGNGTKKAFLHAKFYAFEYVDKVVVFSGSANCSQAAMAMDDTILGNAELMSIDSMSLDDFQKQYLNEYETVDVPYKPMELSDIEDELEQNGIGASVQIISAQYEFRRLRVAYKISEGYEVIGYKIGNNTYSLSPVEKNLLIIDNVNIEHNDTLCLLVNNMDSDEKIYSKEIWIDHEKELSTSARTRSLSDFIQGNQDLSWNYNKWGELIKVFNEHLTYTPERAETHSLNGSTTHQNVHTTFNTSDVFVDSYSFQPVSHILNNRYSFDINSILKQYFALNSTSHNDEELVVPTVQEALKEQSDQDEIEIIDTAPPEITPEPISAHGRTRIQALIRTLIGAFTNKDIIENRPLQTLFDDLKVASIILRMGLKEQWISEEEFFDATYTIWTELFFSSEKDQNNGYIDLKLKNDNIDINELRSPEMSATMLAWIFAVEPSNTLKYIRLVLSAILVHAKYNWIFIGGETEKINEELNRALRAIIDQDTLEKVLQGHADLWKLILQTGDAFAELVEKLSSTEIKELKKLIPDGEVAKGELLWQGKNDFYLVKAKYVRINNNIKNKTEDVVSLNSKKE